MHLITEPYLDQQPYWPASGKHILAQYDDTSIVVYQAYRPAIGHFAARHGYFGGEFSLSRMSWIKPGFLWMQYRSGWGQKAGQEVTLAVHISRSAFDEILRLAVPSTYQSDRYVTQAEWKQAVEQSLVRVQWDPDHDPCGAPLTRRAIQLGLRGEVLARYAREWIVEIEDISDFVAQQRQYACGDYTKLMVPRERVYPYVFQ
ncbi:MAG TPA: DUF4291 domain-containing protein [Ktedonobacteraceae bacterium]|nr:DUF4291 domain-containing protein [Ktedonobacteraceae bacterium]